MHRTDLTNYEKQNIGLQGNFAKVRTHEQLPMDAPYSNEQAIIGKDYDDKKELSIIQHKYDSRT